MLYLWWSRDELLKQIQNIYVNALDNFYRSVTTNWANTLQLRKMCQKVLSEANFPRIRTELNKGQRTPVTDAYLEPSRISTVELFCENI